MKELETNQISLETCVGTDGALNMRLEYNGFRPRVSEEVQLANYVWCYAHVLILVIQYVINSSISCISLFGLLNKSNVFFN